MSKAMDKLIKFADEHPEKCSCEGHNFTIGEVVTKITDEFPSIAFCQFTDVYTDGHRVHFGRLDLWRLVRAFRRWGKWRIEQRIDEN